jgi:legumain
MHEVLQVLDPELNVYAVTAANDIESSWGMYCPYQPIPPPMEYDTCLGDLFSVSFLEDDDILPSNGNETLAEQFKRVHDRVSQHHTYMQGSHVER